MYPNVTQSFKLQRPDLKICRAEAMFYSRVARICLSLCIQIVYRWTLFYCIKTCNHLIQIVKNSNVQPQWLTTPKLCHYLNQGCTLD